MRLAVLKLGGSILTREVGGRPGVRLARLRSLAGDLRGTPPLVLVHGSGAFGKPPAVAHGYLHGHLARGKAAVVSSVAEALERLHGAVLGAVRAAGLPACSVHAAHLFHWSGGRLRLHSDEPARQMLARGIVPVVASGFVADHDGGGFAVASSDALAAELAGALDAERLVFATHAHGVYRNFPRTDAWHEDLAEDDLASLALVAPAAGDVTGGMPGKLRFGFDAARRGIATFVVDGRMAGNVAAALRGDPFTGTRLVSSSSSQHGCANGSALLSMNESTPVPSARPDPALEHRVDALRLRIDEHMHRLFDQLVMAGPMAADPLVRQIYRWSHHYLSSGGRRMHGVAVCLAYEAFGGKDAEAALKIAAAIQLYHHHTMVHDDVYDEDTSRRRWPTTHIAFADWFATRRAQETGAPARLFGNDAMRRGTVAAIAYGKIMRALALHGMGTAGFAPEPTLTASNLLNWHDLFDCAGQMKDVDFESCELPSSQACLNNAWLKTGRLFEICARIGAILAGTTEEQQHAAALWAGNAGVAYQIQDDLEDIEPRSEKGVGRGVGVDLLYCKPTYLYALARELAQGGDRATLAQWEGGTRTPQGVAAIIAVIERSGARRQVEDKVRGLLDEGREALAAVGLSGEAVARLDRFARYFVSRDYWQRALVDGAPLAAALFDSDQPAATMPGYPGSHVDSARHGLPGRG